MMSSGLLQLFEAVALPAIILVIFFIEAAIFHLMLLVVGGAEQPFETTARVVAYVTGSTALFQMVPFCGGLIGLVWSIVVLIIGLAHAHETSMGRSAAAVLLPLFLCCLCCIALITVAAMGLSQVAGGGL